MNDAAIEQGIQAKGKTAARITPADVEANIAYENYFTASQGISAEDACYGDMGDPGPAEFKQVTICVLLLRNGTKIVGVNYGPVDPANFDAAMGKSEARKHAIEQIWPLMGYELKQRLHDAA